MGTWKHCYSCEGYAEWIWFKKVKNTSDKSKDAIEEVQDELEQAEEAFFHAVEEVEEKVVHAIDEEVETLFPHHKNTKEE